jgi:hypothetical protein
VKLPVYMEVARYNPATGNACKDVGFRKSETLKYGVSDFLDYRIDDGYIWEQLDASRYCNTAKVVFGSALDADVHNIRDLVDMEYSEIRSARRLRIRIKEQTDANFDLDINMTNPVIQQFVAQCPALGGGPKNRDRKHSRSDSQASSQAHPGPETNLPSPLTS